MTLLVFASNESIFIGRIHIDALYTHFIQNGRKKKIIYTP